MDKFTKNLDKNNASRVMLKRMSNIIQGVSFIAERLQLVLMP